ncbi:hypothetical protein M885DRAFT_627132 [Pelagophyceae sp. CCMP2097]|nr:hypothetical protein M885DRAFT_627132 [Pelagophyceae sp. CCMP2097]
MGNPGELRQGISHSRLGDDNDDYENCKLYGSLKKLSKEKKRSLLLIGELHPASDAAAAQGEHAPKKARTETQTPVDCGSTAAAAAEAPVRGGVSPPAPPPAAAFAAAALFGSGGGLPSSAGGGGVSPPAARRVGFAAGAPSGGGGGTLIKAGAAVKKLRRLASWAVEHGCPSGCHSFLATVSSGKPAGSTSLAGFKHQHGCAIKYAIEQIRGSSSAVSDPGG